MGEKKPLVSVLMPFYDSGSESNREYFAEAISAILAQTMRDFEIVMVASGEKEFAKGQSRRSKKIRLVLFDQKVIAGNSLPLSEKVYGIVTARNLSIENARGKYVAFADFDDVSVPRRLETQVKFLEAHPEVGAVGSTMRLIGKDGKDMGFRGVLENDCDIRRRMLQFNTVPQPTLLARRALIVKAGAYRLGEIPEDFDLWVRMAKLAKFHNLQTPLIKYRVHPGGGSSAYKSELFFGSMKVKIRAAKELGLRPGPEDVFVNACQFASLFFPNSVRRVVFEKIRSKFVIGSRRKK